MKKILAFFSQSGGANALLPLLQGLQSQFSIVCSGRAAVGERIKKRIPEFYELPELSNSGSILNRWFEEISPDLLITDTRNLTYPLGVEGNVHMDLWALAGKASIPTVAYVDTWSSYKERFAWCEETRRFTLPDAIAVIDEEMKAGLVAAGIATEKINVTGSPRFEAISGNISHNSKMLRQQLGFAEDDIVVLFASQDLEKTSGMAWGFTERTTIADIFTALTQLPSNFSEKLVFVVAPHPEEDAISLMSFVTALKPMFRIRLCSEEFLWDTVSIADLVVGMFSIFLTEVVIMNKPVLSVQIDGEREEVLRSNMLGASLSVKNRTELQAMLIRAIVDSEFRSKIQVMTKKLNIVGDAISRWKKLVSRMMHVNQTI